MRDHHDRQAIRDESPARYQIGGDHYVRHQIQPWDIIECYGLNFWEGNILKYLLRRKENEPRIEALKTLRHYADYLIQREEKGNG